MKIVEKERLIKSDILSIESRVRHAFNQGYDLGYKEGIKKNKKQPKTGHWWERDTYPQECECWDCSECQETVFERTNYCPNCGAKMVDVPDTNIGKMSEIPTGSERSGKE